MTTRIKLFEDLPVDKSHGMTAGREFEVCRMGKGRGKPRWYVMGDAGEEVGVILHEAEVVKPGEADS